MLSFHWFGCLFFLLLTCLLQTYLLSRNLGELRLILVVQKLLSEMSILLSKCEIPIAQQNQEIMDLVDPSTPIYGFLYEKSGVDTAL